MIVFACPAVSRQLYSPDFDGQGIARPIIKGNVGTLKTPVKSVRCI